MVAGLLVLGAVRESRSEGSGWMSSGPAAGYLVNQLTNQIGTGAISSKLGRKAALTLAEKFFLLLETLISSATAWPSIYPDGGSKVISRSQLVPIESPAARGQR